MKYFEVMDMTNGQIINLPNAVNSGDAMPLAQVQALIQSALGTLDAKPTCLTVSTANITLSGAQTINGVGVAAGQRVLVAGQTVSSQNGTYVVASGAWARASDDSVDEMTPGAFFPVQSGTGATYDGTLWQLTTPAPITVGTTSLTFKMQYNPNSTVNKISGTFGDGVSSSFTITHNLNNSRPHVQFFLVSTGEPITCDWTVASVNAITVGTFLSAVASNAMAYEIVG